MAFTYAKQDGYVKATETVTVAAGASTSSGSFLPCTGFGSVLAQVDEDTNLTASIQYTMDSSDITVSGLGRDPSAASSSSTQTWYDCKASEGDAETAGSGDDILELWLIPNNAKFVKVLFTAAGGYAGGTEATELWLDGVQSDIGFSISGLGVDPS